MKFGLPMLALTALAAAAAADDFTALPEARQTIYLGGVPHLAHDGATLTAYDAERSFFPLAIYHPTLYMDEFDRTLPTPFDLIAAAGFNTLHHNRLYEDEFFETAKRHGFRIIKGGSAVEEALRWIDRPEILMWEVFDEPDADGNFEEYPSRFDHFRDYRETMRAAGETRPIFVNTVSWIEDPNLPWWIEWHRTSDISSHDNYPKRADDTPSWSASMGIPESMLLAVRTVEERKPVLFIVQAFGEMAPPEEGERFHFAYPTGAELRSMVYAAVVSGACGIDYFTLDNSVCRNAGQLYGISPAPLESYEGPGHPLAATPEELLKIRSVWEAAAATNRELIRLTPWLLSPTDPEEYQVAVRGVPRTPVPVRAILKQWDGRKVLILVNLDRADLTVRLDFAGAAHFSDFFTGEAASAVLPLEEFGVRVLEVRRGE